MLILEVLWSLRMGMWALISLSLAMYVAWKKAREDHMEDDSYFEAAFGGVIWSVVVARVVYVLLHLSMFGNNPVKWLWITKFPGLDFIGGVIGLGLWLWWWARETEYDWWVVGDWAVLAVAVVNMMWSTVIMSSVRSDLWLLQWPVNPAVIVTINFLVGLLVWVVLWRVENRYRLYSWYRGKKAQANPGLAVALFLLIVGLQRLLVSFVTVDENWYGYGMMVAVGVFVLMSRMGKFDHLVNKKRNSVR